MRASARVALGLAASMLVIQAGCGGVSRTFTTPADEHGAYRRARVGPTFGARLAAAHDYLEAYAAGAYRPEIGAYFAQAEPLYYASKAGSVAGLEDYLRWLPKGPHAEEAATRLASLRATRDRPADLGGVAEAMEARMSKAAEERADVPRVVARWLGVLSDAAIFERPLAEARGDLLVGWTLQLPRPLCAALDRGATDHARRCAKIFELPYTLPIAGETEERQATIEVTIAQDASGRPREVSIAGPQLFVRLWEAQAIRPVDDAARVLDAAVRLVETKTAPGASDRSGCVARAGVVACAGVVVTVTAGASASEDDRIVVRPAPPGGG